MFFMAAAPAAVDIRVNPRVALAPEGVRVQTHVIPHVDNIAVRTVVDCDAFYRSTLQQLEGELGPSIINLLIPQLPVGECYARASLHRRDGTTIYAQPQQFTRSGHEF